MNAKQIRRAKSARTLGIGLVAAGILTLAWLVAASLNPAVPAIPSIETLAPLHRATWMPQPAALLFGLASVALLWLGATIVGRQKAVFEAARRETADRLRRVREYGGDDRVEPYIGSPITIDVDKEPR